MVVRSPLCLTKVVVHLYTCQQCFASRPYEGIVVAFCHARRESFPSPKLQHFLSFQIYSNVIRMIQFITS